MLKYKLEKVDVKMKRTESEELSMDFSALEKEDTKINCAHIDARCTKFQKWATKSMKHMRI